jgi:hypothetical protein
MFAMFSLLTAASSAQDAIIAPMPPFFIFLWAAGGSLALEVISLYNEIRAEKPDGLPRYYKNPVFWIVRLLVTGIAGGLAIAENAGSPLIAINIGASAPAILQLLANSGKAPQGNR